MFFYSVFDRTIVVGPGVMLEKKYLNNRRLSLYSFYSGYSHVKIRMPRNESKNFSKGRERV